MTPRVLVIQLGARRRYAIARILEQAGMLEALYTDSCEYSLAGRVARLLGPRFAGARKLMNRTVDGVPKHKVHATDKPLIYTLLDPGFYKLQGIFRYYRSYEVFAKVMCRWGLGNADLVYSDHHTTLQFLEYAKSRHGYVVIDVCVNPLTRRLMYSQIRKVPLAAVSAYPHVDIEQEERLFQAVAAVADVLLCPSEWVIDGVVQLCPDHKDKIRYCPYGSSIKYEGRRNQPVEGRVFWAGRDWLRKGLHHVAQVANQLRPKYPGLDFRIAGITSPAVVKEPAFRNLHFLGSLDAAQMREEFLSADMFVFPTLAEGQAGVALEAIAAGCPVITTRCAGIDEIRTNENGVIVPEHEVEALREAVERMYCNRAYRSQLADNASELVSHYTVEAWRTRLVTLLRETCPVLRSP